MELDEIRCFLKLCEVGSFTKAAEKCGVSQSTLSRSVQSLENDLGRGPLVARNSGRITPTPLGEYMRPFFERALQSLDDADKTCRSMTGLINANLSVGLMCTIGPTRMIDFFSQFHQRYPGIDLSLRDASVNVLETQLLAGELEVAICCRPDEAVEKFHAVPLFTEGFMVAMHPGHRLARQNVVRIPDLAGERYLSRANCEYRDVLSDMRAEHVGVVLKKRYSSERDDWIQSMVLAGLGISYIPEFAATIDGLVTRRLVDPELYRTVKVVTVRGRPHSPAVAAFISAAKSYPWMQTPAPSLSTMTLSRS